MKKQVFWSTLLMSTALCSFSPMAWGMNEEDKQRNILPNLPPSKTFLGLDNKWEDTENSLLLQEIQKRRKRQEEFLETISERYIKALRNIDSQNGEILWGGDIELAELSEILKFNYLVYKPNEGPLYPGKGYNYDKTIYLWCDDYHYQVCDEKGENKIDAGGGGHCLFHSVLAALKENNNLKEVENLRNQVADKLQLLIEKIKNGEQETKEEKKGNNYKPKTVTLAHENLNPIYNRFAMVFEAEDEEQLRNAYRYLPPGSLRKEAMQLRDEKKGTSEKNQKNKYFKLNTNNNTRSISNNGESFSKTNSSFSKDSNSILFSSPQSDLFEKMREEDLIFSKEKWYESELFEDALKKLCPLLVQQEKTLQQQIIEATKADLNIQTIRQQLGQDESDKSPSLELQNEELPSLSEFLDKYHIIDVRELMKSHSESHPLLEKEEALTEKDLEALESNIIHLTRFEKELTVLVEKEEKNKPQYTQISKDRKIINKILTAYKSYKERLLTSKKGERVSLLEREKLSSLILGDLHWIHPNDARTLLSIDLYGASTKHQNMAKGHQEGGSGGVHARGGIHFKSGLGTNVAFQPEIEWAIHAFSQVIGFERVSQPSCLLFLGFVPIVEVEEIEAENKNQAKEDKEVYKNKKKKAKEIKIAKEVYKETVTLPAAILQLKKELEHDKQRYQECLDFFFEHEDAFFEKYPELKPYRDRIRPLPLSLDPNSTLETRKQKLEELFKKFSELLNPQFQTKQKCFDMINPPYHLTMDDVFNRYEVLRPFKGRVCPRYPLTSEEFFNRYPKFKDYYTRRAYLHHFVQASQTIQGNTLNRFLQDIQKTKNTPSSQSSCQNLSLQDIDLKSYSEQFLYSLLTLQTDVKDDNLMVEPIPNDPEKKFRLVNIDKDRALAHMIIRQNVTRYLQKESNSARATKQEEIKHAIQTKNVLFLIKEWVEAKVPPSVKETFLKLDVDEVLLRWLGTCVYQNKQYNTFDDIIKNKYKKIKERKLLRDEMQQSLVEISEETLKKDRQKKKKLQEIALRFQIENPDQQSSESLKRRLLEKLEKLEEFLKKTVESETANASQFTVNQICFVPGTIARIREIFQNIQRALTKEDATHQDVLNTVSEPMGAYYEEYRKRYAQESCFELQDRLWHKTASPTFEDLFKNHKERETILESLKNENHKAEEYEHRTAPPEEEAVNLLKTINFKEKNLETKMKLFDIAEAWGDSISWPWHTPELLFQFGIELLKSAPTGCESYLERILSHKNFDLKAVDDAENTLLHHWVRSSLTDCKLNEKEEIKKEEVLVLKKNHLKNFLTLWEKRDGKLDTVNQEGESVLDFAFLHKRGELVKLLLQPEEGQGPLSSLPYYERYLEFFYHEVKKKDSWTNSKSTKNSLRALFRAKKEQDPYFRWTLQRSKVLTITTQEEGEDVKEVKLITRNPGQIKLGSQIQEPRFESEIRYLTPEAQVQLWNNNLFKAIHENKATQRKVGWVIPNEKKIIEDIENKSSQKVRHSRIYFKMNPASAGTSLAIMELETALFGAPSLPITFAKIKGAPFTLSPGVGRLKINEDPEAKKPLPPLNHAWTEEGNFHKILATEDPKLKKHPLHAEELAKAIFMAILINPEDDKPSNFILERIKGTKLNKPITIDTEQAFVPSAEKPPEEMKGYIVRAKSILYCLNQMNDPHLLKTLREQIQRWNPVILMKTWVSLLGDLHTKMQSFFTEKEHVQLEKKESPVGIPFGKGEIGRLIKKLLNAQGLSIEKDFSFMGLLQEVEPFIAQRYLSNLKHNLKFQSSFERFKIIDGPAYKNNSLKRNRWNPLYVAKEDFATSTSSSNVGESRDIPRYEEQQIAQQQERMGGHVRWVYDVNHVSQLKPGELGVFCEGEDLYCKLEDRAKKKIEKSNDVDSSGMKASTFERIKSGLKEKNRIRNKDKSTLVQYVLSCGYTRHTFDPTGALKELTEEFMEYMGGTLLKGLREKDKKQAEMLGKLLSVGRIEKERVETVRLKFKSYRPHEQVLIFEAIKPVTLKTLILRSSSALTTNILKQFQWGQITHLNLKGCSKIDVSLLHLVEKCESLETLILDDCADLAYVAGRTLIWPTLLFSNLQKLYLNQCAQLNQINIKADKLETLEAKDNPNLTILKVQSSSLTTVNISKSSKITDQILDNLGETCPQLKTVKHQACPLLSYIDGMQDWPFAIQKKLTQEVRKKIKSVYENNFVELDLSEYKISDEDIQALFHLFQHNKTLRSLNLSWNEIGDAGATTLAKSLGDNTVLIKLDLEGNKIGSEGVRALMQSLEHNSSLIELNLGEIDNETAEELIKMDLHTTCELSLYNNSYNQKLLEWLKKKAQPKQQDNKNVQNNTEKEEK